MSASDVKSTMTPWEKYNRIVSSIAAFTLEKMLFSLIAPIIAQYHWSTSYDNNSITYALQDECINSTDCELQEHYGTVVAPYHLSPELLAIFLSTPVIGFFVSPIGGWLGDKYGFDILMLAGLVISSTVSGLFAASTDFSIILTARILIGFVVILHSNGLGRVFQVVTPETHEGNIVIGLMLSSYAFQFFGPAICGLLFKYFGLRIAFLSLIPIEALIGTSIIFTYNLNSEELRQEDEQELNSKSNPPSHQTFWQLICDRRIIIASLLVAVCWFPKACLEPVLAIWIKEQFDGDEGMSSYVWGMAGFGVLFGNLISVFILKRYPDLTLLYTVSNFAMFTLPVGFLPFMTSPTGAAIVFTIMIYFASAAKFGCTNIVVGISEREYEPVMGRVMGIFTVGFVLPYLVAPLIAIPLYNKVGFHHMCIILTPISIVFTPLLCFIKHKNSDFDLLPSEENMSKPEYVKDQHLPQIDVNVKMVQPVNKD